LYWVSVCLFSCAALFVSISQVIGCEDRLQNDLLCVGWGVKLYSLTLGKLSQSVIIDLRIRVSLFSSLKQSWAFNGDFRCSTELENYRCVLSVFDAGYAEMMKQIYRPFLPPNFTGYNFDNIDWYNAYEAMAQSLDDAILLVSCYGLNLYSAITVTFCELHCLSKKPVCLRSQFWHMSTDFHNFLRTHSTRICKKKVYNKPT